MRQIILDLIKAQNPVTLQEIVAELMVQTDFFEKYSTLAIELEIALAIEELICENKIRLDIDIQDYSISFDLF